MVTLKYSPNVDMLQLGVVRRKFGVREVLDGFLFSFSLMSRFGCRARRKVLAGFQGSGASKSTAAPSPQYHHNNTWLPPEDCSPFYGLAFQDAGRNVEDTPDSWLQQPILLRKPESTSPKVEILISTSQLSITFFRKRPQTRQSYFSTRIVPV